MLFRLEPQLLIILAFCLMFALSFHEFAHAYAANRLGDSTAKMVGRMSVNPLVHLDIFGSLMVLIAGFGYAKPVPVNPRNFRFPHAGAIVAAAGPLMNLLLGMIGVLLIHLLDSIGWLYMEAFPLAQFLTLFIMINFNLFLFNMIPLGPLDGSYVLPSLLNRNWSLQYEAWNSNYGSQVLFGLVLVSIALPGFSVFSWIPGISSWLLQLLLF